MTANRGPGVSKVGAIGTTTTEHRLQLAGLYAENAPGVPRSGVLAQATPLLVVGKANMSYDIGPCALVVNRTASEGVYTPTLTGTTNVPTGNAPGSGSRWDLIWVKQNDTAKGDADNQAIAGVTQGLAGAIPAKPYGTVPAGAYVLAEAQIFAGTTGTSGGLNTLTQIWRHTAARGAPIPVRNLPERDEITGAAKGQEVIRLDLPGAPKESWDGLAWQPRPGCVGYLYEPATSAGFSSGEWFVNQINEATLKKGHRYELLFQFNHVFPSAANLPFVITFKKSPTAATGTTGTGVGAVTIWSAPSANSGKTDIARAVYVADVDETVRILITTGRLAGSSLYDISSRTLTVEDKGLA